MSKNLNYNILNSQLNSNNKAYWFFSSIRTTPQTSILTDLAKTYFENNVDLNQDIVIIQNSKDSDSRNIHLVRFIKPSVLLSSIFYEDFTFNSNQVDCDWGSKSSNDFLDYLQSKGMDFSKKEIRYEIPFSEESELISAVESNNIKNYVKKFENTKHEVDTFFTFNRGYQPQRRTVELLKRLAKSISKEEMLERSEKSNILFEATINDYSIINDYLINEIKVDINKVDGFGRKPIMLCKTSNTLEPFLKRDDLELFSVDKNSKDVFHYFATLQDKKQSKDMVNKLQDYIKSKPVGEQDLEAIENANKKTLLAMVVSDKNKKEIEDFLKKTKLKDFNDIVDEKGRSMAQLSAAKDNWGKFTLVKKGYNVNFRDKTGYGLIEYLLPKIAPKFQKKAIDATNEVLKDLGSDAGFNMLRRFMRLNRTFNVPKWYLSDKTVDIFLDAFTGEDYRKENRDNFLKHVRTTSHYGTFTTYDMERINDLKEFARPYLIHAIDNGYTDKIENIDILKLCSVKNRIENDPSSGDYSVSITALANLKALFELGVEYDLNLDNLDKRIETTIVDYINKGWPDISTRVGYNGTKMTYAIGRFAQESAQLINFLMDRNSSVIENFLNDDLRNTIKEEAPEIYSKIDPYLLNKKLTNDLSKEFTANKKKNIKI